MSAKTKHVWVVALVPLFEADGKHPVGDIFQVQEKRAKALGKRVRLAKEDEIPKEPEPETEDSGEKGEST